MILKKILDLIFTKRCINCKRKWEYICKNCKKLLKVYPECCPICKKYFKDNKVCFNCLDKDKIYFDWVIVWFRFTNIIKKLIYWIKYFHTKDFKNEIWKKLSILLEINESIKINKKTIITSVPCHQIKKIFTRWYNQSEIIWKEISKTLWIEYLNIYKKNKYTVSQTKLSRQKRINNVKNTFSLKNINIDNIDTIIIVDDLFTTWSTINELSKLVKIKNKKIRIRWVVMWRN